jgi:Ca-activated chloride channel family protein
VIRLWITLPILMASTVIKARADQQPTFPAAVSLVRVDVLVTDGKKPVSNLTPQDFEVLDNGVPQKVESILGATEPLDVLFTLDRSASVKGRTIRQLKEASEAVLDQLNPTDRAGLLTFNHSFLLEAPLTTDQLALRAAINRLKAGGATALLDAVYVALTLAESRTRRSVILLCTDGHDNQSWLSKPEVLQVARESEALVYALALKAADSDGTGETLLRELTGATGGRVIWVDANERLTGVFLSMLREMRDRYLLTYSPAGVDASGWHTLSVRLKHKRGRVVAREGYLVPVRQQPGQTQQ